VNNIAFSGDLGNQAESLNKPLENLPPVDYLVLESTYGDRLHKDLDQRKIILEKILERIIYEKRVLIIPTFALERAQEIIFDIQDLIEKKRIPKIRMFLDSPLAFRITKIYQQYPQFLNDNVAREILANGIFNKDYLKIIQNNDDEKEMYLASAPKVILAGSGMVTGGKILKILRNYIENKETTILFVGYQAEGSLGRKILEGAKEIEIDNQKLDVKAEILTLFAYSAHRDQAGILDWLKPQKYNLKTIFLTHGEKISKNSLKTKIMDELAIKTVIPNFNDSFVL
jgi:metallo-beta-lactamase family protein